MCPTTATCPRGFAKGLHQPQRDTHASHLSASQLCLHPKKRQGRANHPFGFRSHCSQVRTWPTQKGTRRLPHGQPLEASHLPSPVPPQGGPPALWCILANHMEEQKPHPSLHDGRFDLKFTILCAGGVGECPAYHCHSLCACRGLKEEKQTREAESQAKALWKSGPPSSTSLWHASPSPSALPCYFSMAALQRGAGESGAKGRSAGLGGGGRLGYAWPLPRLCSEAGLCRAGGATGDVSSRGDCPCKACAHPHSACSAFLCHSNENNRK